MLARDLLVAIDENLISKGVEEIDAVVIVLSLAGAAERVVNDEEEVLAQRVGLPVIVGRTVGSDLRLGEELVGGNAADRRHRVVPDVVVLNHRVEQNDRAEVLGVVPARRADEQIGVGDLLKGGLEVRARGLVLGVVPLNRARVATVGESDPRMVRLVEPAIDVVPARVDDHPVLVDGRGPLVRLVNAEGDDIASVGVHRVQGVAGAGARVAATVASAALGDEDDPSVREEARIDIVPRTVGELG